MNDKRTPYEFSMEISRDLNLEFHEQDWGLINEDADRLSEFVSYFLRNHDSVPDKFKDLFVYDMTELILESARHCVLLHRESQLETRDFAVFWSMVANHHAGELVIAELLRPWDDPAEARAAKRLLGYLDSIARH